RTNAPPAPRPRGRPQSPARGEEVRVGRWLLAVGWKKRAKSQQPKADLAPHLHLGGNARSPAIQTYQGPYGRKEIPVLARQCVAATRARDAAGARGDGSDPARAVRTG